MVYIFFRDIGWYPIELSGGHEEACINAECNPGTIKVETWEGHPVWDSEHQDAEAPTDTKEPNNGR